MEAGMSKEVRKLLDDPHRRFNVVGAYLIRKAKEDRIAMRNFRSMGRVKLKRRHPYETTRMYLESIADHAEALVADMDNVSPSDRYIYDEDIERTIANLKLRIEMLDEHHKKAKKEVLR